MGLAHSPKIVTDGLSFMYDTGSSKSYKGEPTTIYGDPFPTDTTLPGGFHWSYEYDHEIVDAPITGHFLSNRKWVKSTRDTTGSRRVLFINNSFTAGNTYTFSCYAYSNDTNLTSLAHVSHNSGYSVRTDYTEYATADLGKVKRIHGTWIQQVNGGPIFGMQTNDAALGTTFYMTGFQVEEKTRATQLTGGSRSTTQGLLDLTKNETITLSNLSYDSNAQMSFDGTDDNFQISDPGVGTSFSIEIVIKVDSYSNGPIFVSPNSVGIDHFFRVFNNGKFSANFVEVPDTANDGYTSTTVINTGEYYHVVISKTPSNGTLYVNGVAEDSHTPTLPAAAWTGAWRIGARWNNTFNLNGEIPILKVYNRDLAPAEVLQNYNALKSRFT